MEDVMAFGALYLLQPRFCLNPGFDFCSPKPSLRSISGSMARDNLGYNPPRSWLETDTDRGPSIDRKCFVDSVVHSVLDISGDLNACIHDQQKG